MTKYYFDYASTTPVDPEVAQKMQQCLSLEAGFYGNASAQHDFGKRAIELIENARQLVADLVHTAARNILFTSGATESNNLAIKGVATFYQKLGKHIITSATEHVSVLECCQYLESIGFEITYLKPNKDGLINIDDLNNVIRSDTILVSIMHVNNETGVIQNIAEIGKITKAKKIIFHVDAVQSLGKIPIDLETLPVDLMSFSAHKIYGPKGIGALYIGDKPRIRLVPQVHGGSQERKLRPGTLATHQIVGLGEACHLIKLNRDKNNRRIMQLNQRLLVGLNSIDGIKLNVDLLSHHENHTHYLCIGIVNICFKYFSKDQILRHLAPFACSSAAACNSIHMEPSHVLTAMGLSEQEAAQSVRFSIGRFTTESDIDALLQRIRLMNSAEAILNKEKLYA